MVKVTHDSYDSVLVGTEKQKGLKSSSEKQHQRWGNVFWPSIRRTDTVNVASSCHSLVNLYHRFPFSIRFCLFCCLEITSFLRLKKCDHAFKRYALPRTEWHSHTCNTKCNICNQSTEWLSRLHNYNNNRRERFHDTLRRISGSSFLKTSLISMVDISM